jgi:1,4-alpha-glucan branching enzyme
VQYDYRIGVPRAGTYRELFNSDNSAYGGSNVHNAHTLASDAIPWQGREHSIRLTLPPLAGLMLMHTGQTG